MTDRDRDRRDHTRPQDSKPYKYHDFKHQDTHAYKHKPQRHQEEWKGRTRYRDRDDAWSREQNRRSRSPPRFGYRQEVGRLSPTPHESAYQTDWRKRKREKGEGVDELPKVWSVRGEQDPIDPPRARLEAQIAAMTTEELSSEIDMLIQGAKEEAGLHPPSAHKMMELEVEYGRLGWYEDLGGRDQMVDPGDEVYGPVQPTMETGV